MTPPNERLADVAIVIMGTSPKGETYNDNGIGRPLLNGPTEFGQSFPTCTLYTTDSKKECLPGDLICCVRGSTTGRMNWADKVYSLGRGVCSIRGRTRLDTKYIRYCIDHRLESLLKLAGGGTFPSLTQDSIRDFPIPYSASRHKIASILSAYDDLIENNTRRIAILEAMAQAIYREWFVDFRFPCHEKVKFVDSPLGEIPAGWKVEPLGEIAAVTMGTSPKGDTYNDEGDGTPLVNGPVEFGERFTKRAKWTTAPGKFCEEGDLVVCVRGSTTGKYVKSDGVYCLGRGVCGLSSKYQCFVNLLFENERPALLAQTGGSTFPSWTGPQLKSHLVVSPPCELLERFEELVNPIGVAVLVYSRQMQNLRTTRDLLLPKLISGQLDVEDLDIETAEAVTMTE